VRDEVGRLAVPGPRPPKGRLEIKPDSWVFKNMHGRNGQTIINANAVSKAPRFAQAPNAMIPPSRHCLEAQNHPLLSELRNALPRPGAKKTWNDDQPLGLLRRRCRSYTSRRAWRTRTSCRAAEGVERAPGDPPPPRAQTLRGTIDLPLENVLGRFVFDNGLWTMTTSTSSSAGRTGAVRSRHGAGRGHGPV